MQFLTGLISLMGFALVVLAVVYVVTAFPGHRTGSSPGRPLSRRNNDSDDEDVWMDFFRDGEIDGKL